jgi:SAM-dependent methyltransferase
MLLRELVEKTGLVPAHYTAFEPNPCHVAPLRRVVSDLGVSHDVRALPFFEHTQLDQTYDLVLFSHSLYWMADPARAMLHAASAVVGGGLTLAVIGGPYGVHAMFPLFEPSIERLSPMLQNNAISSHEVVAGLRAQGANPGVRILPTPIDLTGLFEPERLPELGEFISFCMQIEFTQLPGWPQADMIGYVRGGCVPQGDRWYWYLPTAVLTLER